jgi:hypothetical protein
LKRAVLLLLFLQFLPAVGKAGDWEFDELVGRMSDYCQKRPMRGMGIINFIANRFAPHGVGHLQMAIFEDIPAAAHSPEQELESFLHNLVGPEYQSFIRDRNNHSQEVSFIYFREAGNKNFEMLIVSLERTEAVVMKMRLDPDAMHDWMDEPVSHGHHASHPGR